MQTDQHFLESKDGHRVFVRKWQPDASADTIGVIHINHGMAEHSQRYESIAEKLTQQGYAVVAHDHRGHGHSIPQGGLVGHYGDVNGWSLVISDVKAVNDYIQQTFPNLPIAILGHSMGSFITQYFCIEHSHCVDAVILSGSGYTSAVALRAPKMLIRLEKFRTGPKARSKLIDRQTFQSFNKQLGKTRTQADWLSRDTHQVDKYLSDPLCGFLCTNQLWEDFIGGLEAISKEKNLRAINNTIPFFLISGERDPLSFNSRKHGIERLAEHMRSSGLNDVTFKLYEGGRHEIFNELNRDEVVDELLVWINSRLKHLYSSKKPEAAIA